MADLIELYEKARLLNLQNLAHGKIDLKQETVSNLDYLDYVFSAELFEEYERFNCDMIVYYDNLTCKGSKAMTGMIQDIANERNIPLVWISHDLIDPRAVPRSAMRKQFNDFMFSVMNEQPLDESLLDFDDSKGW